MHMETGCKKHWALRDDCRDTSCTEMVLEWHSREATFPLIQQISRLAGAEAAPELLLTPLLR